MGGFLEEETNLGISLLIIGFFDLLIWTFVPPGEAWLHEEWHRAVLSRHRISSYNEVYEFNFFSSTISVSHVDDNGLVRLKRDNLADMVRLSEAGIEAQYYAIKISRENYFFSGKDNYYALPGWWLSTLNSVLYIHTCTTSEADKMTDKINRREKLIPERDFVGLDFTAWVYDLHRPNESYHSRGKHPSGKGIDRYIKNSDLSEREKKYLKKMFNLSLLNFVSPQFFGFNRFAFDFSGSGKIYYNAALMHYLTPFGYTAELHVMVKSGIYNIIVIPRIYSSHHKTLPGLELSLYRYPVVPFGIKLYSSTSVALWLQPEDSSFYSDIPVPGGMLCQGISFPMTENLEAYITGEIKSSGWVAGFVELNKAWRVTTGIIFIL
jgi:hypothetical protein